MKRKIWAQEEEEEKKNIKCTNKQSNQKKK